MSQHTAVPPSTSGPASAAGSRLPRSTPAEQGVAAAGISRFLDAVLGAGNELHSLMLLRHGHVVAEGWWEPYEPDGLHLLYSLSKSFTSTAIGLAVHEGRLSVDDLVTSFFPESLPEGLSAGSAALRVRHLLTMATGHHEDTLDRLDRSDLVRSFLTMPPDEEPGTWFTYHNTATLMLSAILTRVTGDRLLDYLRPRLLEPLGIDQANWQGVGGAGGAADLPGLDLGFSGLHLATESVAKLGQLYLQQGRWNSEQLVPQEWVAAATRAQVDNPREPNPDWRKGYGYQFWLAREGYRGDGAFGQFCIVLPQQDMVLALTGATEDMQSVLDCVWFELLPALGHPSTDDEASGAELAARLSSLALPTPSGERHPARITLPWSAPSTPGSAESFSAPGTAATQVLGIEEQEGGWLLTVQEADVRFSVAVGYGEWTVTDVEPRPGFRLRVAASGAWSADTFTVALALVETPHRLTLVCDCTSGLTSARWNAVPLGVTSATQLALELSRG